MVKEITAILPNAPATMIAIITHKATMGAFEGPNDIL
jgi:hypothetical protein